MRMPRRKTAIGSGRSSKRCKTPFKPRLSGARFPVRDAARFIATITSVASELIVNPVNGTTSSAW